MTMRWRLDLAVVALAGAFVAGPASAQDQPKPLDFSLAPISARNLLAPIDEPAPVRPPRLSAIDADRQGLLEPPPFRFEREGDAITGKRARLSVGVGDTTLFAIGGRLTRRPLPGPPDPTDSNRALGSRKMESGKVYGVGAERRIGPADVSASYQYSTINAGPVDEGMTDIDNSRRSHSVRATARIRFRN